MMRHGTCAHLATVMLADLLGQGRALFRAQDLGRIA
jgi:hypothetical protein